MPINRGLVKPMIVLAIQLNTVKLNKQFNFGYSCDKVSKVVMLGKKHSGVFVHSMYHLVSFV